MQQRKIIHVDMDAFYASVELHDRPELQDKPVVVAWDGPRSVICAASYNARRYGLHSAMPVATAKRLCPQAIYIPPDFERYRAVSQQVQAIFACYTTQIEPVSLDEAYLDVTEYKGNLPYARDIARAIRAEILKQTGLTASAGIAPNKLLAKIASDWRKPNGQFVIAPCQVEAFLKPLPISKIPGIGKVTEQKIHALGCKTVGELAQLEQRILVQHFGRWGYRLFEYAHGRDNRKVKTETIRQQISNEITLTQDLDRRNIGKHIPELANRLSILMQRKQIICLCVTLKLKTNDFHIYTRSQTFSSPLYSKEALILAANQLLQRMPDKNFTYRLIGLGVSQFDTSHHQPELWSVDSFENITIKD